jgi:hypothetical protein
MKRKSKERIQKTEDGNKKCLKCAKMSKVPKVENLEAETNKQEELFKVEGQKERGVGGWSDKASRFNHHSSTPILHYSKVRTA